MQESEIGNFIGELGAGVFEEKLTRSIKETALACMANNKAGEITLKFKITPINQSQAKITHNIVTKAPRHQHFTGRRLKKTAPKPTCM